MTDGPCSADELRRLFLFERLTDDQLDWLCQRGRVESFPAGPVYAEGDPAASVEDLALADAVRWPAMGEAGVLTVRTGMDRDQVAVASW